MSRADADASNTDRGEGLINGNARQRLSRLRDLATHEVLPPLVAFCALTTLVFAPLISRLGDGVLRGATDGAQVVRYLWLLDHLDSSPFGLGRDPYVGAPEGVPITSALEIAQPVQPTALWVGSQLFGETATFNLFLLSGFVLTGLAGHLLLRRLGLHPFAAFSGAAMMTFNPWMIERALEGHSAFVHMWPLLLLLGALIAVHESRRPVAALAVGAALGLCFLTTAYTGLLGLLVGAVFLGKTFAVSRGWADKLWVVSLTAVALAAASLFVLPGAIAYLADEESANAVAQHSAEELGGAGLGATLSGYVRPSAQHPLLGSLGVEPRLGTGNGETVLYLGITTIALAIAGAVLFVRRRAPLDATPLRSALGAAMVLAPVALVLSLPPQFELAGATVPLPSKLLAETTTFYRVYARFGFIVLVALALLASAALHILLQHRRGSILAGAAVGLLAFEFLPGLLPVWSPEKRDSDRWLEAQPRGIVANYPMPTDQLPSLRLAYEEQFRQRLHSQPLFALLGAGTGGTREEAIRLVARYVTAPDTPGILAAERVRYVLLHDRVYREQREAPPPIPPGLRLVWANSEVRVLALEPTVLPVDLDAVLEQQAAALAAVQGLGTPTVEIEADAPSTEGEGRGAIAEEASLDVRTSDARVRRIMVLVRARSRGGPRTLQLLDEAGLLLGAHTVNTTDTQIMYGPLALLGPMTRLRLRVLPTAAAGPSLSISETSAQPLADFSISLRAR